VLTQEKVGLLREDFVRFLPQQYYHLYNRGNNRLPIFLEEENYRFFLRRLHQHFDQERVEIVAYCLMPNHYHVLGYLENEVDFSNVLRGFTTSYVRSFNRWHGRVGYLFQGNTQAKLIDRDEYLVHLCRYIHLNPVQAGLVVHPEEWEYSDYREWISEENSPISAGRRVREDYIGTGEDYEKFVCDFADAERMMVKVEERLFAKTATK
jgi:putative transposase